MTKADQSSSFTTDSETAQLLASAASRLSYPIQEQSEILLRIGLALALRSVDNLIAAEALYQSVVKFCPDHEGAVTALVQTAASRGVHELVLDRAEQARLLIPNSPLIARLEADAWSNLAQTDKAIEVLSDAVTHNPNDFHLQLALAQALKRNGDFEETLIKFAHLRDNFSEHDIVWFQSIDLLHERGAYHEAIEVCDSAPKQSVEIDWRRARAMRILGRSKEAYEILRQRLASEDMPHARLLNELGSILLAMGQLAAADNCFVEAISTNPDIVAAYIGRANVSRVQNDLDNARYVINEARQRWPDNLAVICSEANILIQLHRPREALDLLNRARGAGLETPQLMINLATSMLRLGDLQNAEAVCLESLRKDPKHQDAALRLVDVLLSLKDVRKARGILDKIVRSIEGDTERKKRPLWINPEIQIRRAELSIRLEDHKAARMILTDLKERMRNLLPRQQIRIFRMALKLDLSDIAAKNVELFFSTPNVSGVDASTFFDIVRKLSGQETARGISDKITSLVRECDRESVRLVINRELDGPIAALVALRSEASIGMRPFSAALQLSKTLVAAGERTLANRYLRFCLRRWPLVPEIVHGYLSNCLRIGLFEDAAAFLDGLDPDNQRETKLSYKIRLLAEMGDLDAALEAREADETLGSDSTIETLLLQIYLAKGDVKNSEALVEKIRALPSTARRYQAHFQASYVGNRLNELRILSKTDNCRRECMPEDAEFAFFQPAKETVDHWLQHIGSYREHGAEIPKRITQYWDSSTPPPSVSDVMETWQNVSGYDYKRLDSLSAQDELRQFFGKDHYRAFRLANSKTEASDFLRLCMLWVYGGIYVDADDRLIGHPSQMLQDVKGCLIYREPFGAISNNLICAAPRHPLIGEAKEMAKISILSRENDNTWSKTGPGMITRALATLLRRDPSCLAKAGITIRDEYELYRHVSAHVILPYKTSSAYWNWQGDKTCPKPVAEALERASHD